MMIQDRLSTSPAIYGDSFTMNYRHIEIINAIIKTGTISGAARLLNVSQPNVSRVLSHAEHQVGFPLFSRQKNGLIPTPEARSLLPDMDLIVRQMEVINERARFIRQGNSMALRIGSVPSLAESIMPDALIKIKNRFPELAIELTTLHFDTACERVLNNQLDVALVFSQRTSSWATAREICHGRLVAVSPKSMKMTARSISLSSLIRRKLIALPASDPLGQILHDALVDNGLPTDTDFTIRTYSVLVDLVLAGGGVAIVDPFTAVRYRDRLNIARVEPVLPFSVALFHHNSIPLSAAGTYLLDILCEQLVDDYVE